MITIVIYVFTIIGNFAYFKRPVYVYIRTRKLAKINNYQIIYVNLLVEILM